MYLYTYMCECIVKGTSAYTPYEARYAETEMTCDLEIFAAYVIANYRPDLVCNRDTTGCIFHNIRSKVSTRLCNT